MTTMTQQHFVFIADLIADLIETDVITQTQGIQAAQIAAENLRQTNRGFKPQVFLDRALGELAPEWRG